MPLKKFAIESINPAFPVIWLSNTAAPAGALVVLTVAAFQFNTTLFPLNVAVKLVGEFIVEVEVSANLFWHVFGPLNEPIH